jgi:hypothetical protein
LQLFFAGMFSSQDSDKYSYFSNLTQSQVLSKNWLSDGYYPYLFEFQSNFLGEFDNHGKSEN